MSKLPRNKDDGKLNDGIQKDILKSGCGDVPHYKSGTKVTFHYITRRCDADKTVLDDSHNDKPFELIIGKQFKLEAWEACIKTMRDKEQSSFTVPAALSSAYPLVSKSLRDMKAGKPSQTHHCCGAFTDGMGYDDLNLLMKQPQPLEFILEILKVDEPGDYEKEVWIMNEDEKLKEVPKLREKGNALYREKNYKDATDVYAKAIGILEQLLLKEKPGDEPYLALVDKKLPLLLNYSQCKLLQGSFYEVIEHTTEVLKYQPENVKAVFRRAKAHAGAWNPEEARTDFKRAAELDPTLSSAVSKELRLIQEQEKKRENEDRAKLQGKLFS